MKTIKYDFSKFDSIMHQIKDNPSSSNMNALQRELNSFFKDSHCNGVIYTKNTDKLFFGMCVMPDISDIQVDRILVTDERVRVNSYYLELDSKLFDPLLGLTSQELTAVLLHEVGHLVNDATPVDELRKEIDVYLAKENEAISIENAQYSKIIGFGVKDYIRKVGSLFEKKDDELLADEFVYSCGYGKSLESAFKKIVKNNKILSKDVNNKFLVLRWTLLLYKDIKHRRLAAIRVLNKGKSLDGSVLEKREKEALIRNLNNATINESVIEAAAAEFRAKKGIFSNMRVKGAKALEDELYEFAVRLKTLNTEEDALVMLRQINYRISLIDEYMRVENLSEDEKNRWYNLKDDYNNIRNKIVEKDLGKTKTYGLWIAYPDKER